MSAWGGYVIIGTTKGIDHVAGYPGITATVDDIDALRRSVLDRVRPAALFRGPRSFDADVQGNVVLVFQVFRHPTGLPASVDGVFWIRTADETRRMEYEEVRRRFVEARDLTAEAAEQAEAAMEKAAGPIRSELHRLARERGHPELRVEPFTVGCVPIGAPRDLGRSGRELLTAFRTAASRAASAFFECFRSPVPDLTEDARATVDGIEIEHSGLQKLRSSHDGVFSAAWTTIVSPLSPGSSTDPSYVESVAALLSGLGLMLIHELVGPSAVFVSLDSGSIYGLPGGGQADRSGVIARHEFTTASRGPGAATAVANGCRLLAERMADASGRITQVRHEEGLNAFLESLLR